MKRVFQHLFHTHIVSAILCGSSSGIFEEIFDCSKVMAATTDLILASEGIESTNGT